MYTIQYKQDFPTAKLLPNFDFKKKQIHMQLL